MLLWICSVLVLLGAAVSETHLSSAKGCYGSSHHITAQYAGLLGVNVIGTAVAWALAAVALLENPFGSGLVRDSVDGNNFVQAGKRLFDRRHRAAHLGDMPADADDSPTVAKLQTTDSEDNSKGGDAPPAISPVRL